MSKTALYTVSLTGDTLTINIGRDTVQMTYGANQWDIFAWAHGVKQKVGDRGAIPRDPDTGKSATDAEKQARMLETAQRLATGGTWNTVAEGGGSEGGLLYRALIELGASPERAREKLAAMSRAEQAALRANPRVVPIIDRLRAKVGEGIDSDELLSEIL
jgi:hypothetical protein